MRFIWDPAKAASNLEKHGVSFEEAATAFRDQTAIYDPDPKHPERGNLTGHSATSRLLFVVNVELLTESPPAMRIIHARKANKRQRDHYYAKQMQLQTATTKPRRIRKSKEQYEEELEPSKPPPRKKRRKRHEED